ncbi:TonB family protein [Flavobacterium sp. W1B]|uniref:TonB family protein n=1 Tax=Flavobacterium sp. W1B TaxID=3394146 RepID=UPI0039BD9242
MKNKLYTIALLLITSIAFSQTSKAISAKIFLDSLGSQTSEANHKYYRIIRNYNLESDSYVINDYYKSGKIKMKGISTNRDNLKREGAFINYYENGNKKSISNYKNNTQYGIQYNYFDDGTIQGVNEVIENHSELVDNYKIIQFWNKEREQKVINGNGEYETTDSAGIYLKGRIKDGLKDGEWQGYSKSFSMKFIEFYTEGKLVSGITTDSNGIELPYTALFEKPKSEKGIEHFYKYVGNNLIIPKEALINRISGKIYLLFTIEKNGSVVDVRVLKGLDNELDKEAIRVIKNYKKWVPGKMRGVPVRVSHTIPITIV